DSKMQVASRRTLAVVLTSIALVMHGAPRVYGACNLIPSASKTFRSTLGATNRPFAAPGDFVELRVDPSNCDAASLGFPADPLQQVVTVVFTPAGATSRQLVVLAGSCTTNPVKAQLSACQAALGLGSPPPCV